MINFDFVFFLLIRKIDLYFDIKGGKLTMASFWRKYKLKNGSVVNTQDPIAKNWIDAFNKIDYSKSGK